MGCGSFVQQGWPSASQQVHKSTLSCAPYYSFVVSACNALEHHGWQAYFLLFLPKLQPNIVTSLLDYGEIKRPLNYTKKNYAEKIVSDRQVVRGFK